MSENLCPKCQFPNSDTARFCSNCGSALLGGVSPVKPVISSFNLEVGALLQGRYRIEKELGRGGFGAVYRAWDNNLNRPCAVKENLEISPEAQRQFMREATVLANLSHPHLPRVTDYFLVPDQGQYLVMDFVEGEDLSSRIERTGAVSVSQAVEWIREILDALVYLHNRQPPVVHRDIKPANIRVTPEGRAMLVDFGLVKMYDPGVKTTMGARAITPGYAPPEQYGRGSTDPRTDVYALGATLYYILTGHDPLESVQRMAGEQMPTAISLNAKLPARVSQTIERAMALEPGQRFQTAEEFKNLLQPVAAPVASTVVVPQQPESGAVRTVQVPISKPISPPESKPVSKPVSKPLPAKRRNWMILGLIGFFVLLCVGGSLGAFAWFLNDQQNRDADRKEETRIALAVTQTIQNRKTQTQQAVGTAEAYRRETDTARVNANATAEAQATLIAVNATTTALAQIEATVLAYTGELNLAKKWNGVFMDTFDQNSYDWPSGAKTGERADITWTIADGIYKWDALAKEGFVWWVYPEMEEYGDFYYAVDLSILQGPSEAEQGLVYRMKKNGEEYSYYLYEISNNQQYSVWYRDANGWEEIIPWTSSDLIRNNGTNRLALIAQGSRMVFFINDQFLAEVADDKLSSGKLGLSVGLDENGQSGLWQFDNLEIRLP